jgi:hypothetical protein
MPSKDSPIYRNDTLSSTKKFMVCINEFLCRSWTLDGFISLIKQLVHHEAVNILFDAYFNYLLIVDTVLHVKHEAHNVPTDVFVADGFFVFGRSI